MNLCDTCGRKAHIKIPVLISSGLAAWFQCRACFYWWKRTGGHVGRA